MSLVLDPYGVRFGFKVQSEHVLNAKSARGKKRENRVSLLLYYTLYDRANTENALEGDANLQYQEMLKR